MVWDEKGKLCYTNTESFTVHVKTEDIYETVAKAVKEKSHTSNYKL